LNEERGRRKEKVRVFFPFFLSVVMEYVFALAQKQTINNSDF